MQPSNLVENLWPLSQQVTVIASYYFTSVISQSQLLKKRQLNVITLAEKRIRLDAEEAEKQRCMTEKKILADEEMGRKEERVLAKAESARKKNEEKKL